MQKKFIGRVSELQSLNKIYQSPEGKLVVIYGRRRIGKSRLIEQFILEKKHLRFEGLEQGRTQIQINNFTADLAQQLNDSLLAQVKISTWLPILDYLTTFFANNREKCILFLDEFQWLCVNQSKLVSLIKKYWDLYWSKQGVMLILCGSVSSFMTKRVISSKALYGRINLEICLQPLNPVESFQLLDGKRSPDEVLHYILLLGGIPKYLKEIDANKSFDQNINELFFTQNSILSNDYERIFYSQFKEYTLYEQIVHFLKEFPKSLEEVAKKIRIVSGGGVKSYLKNLEKALFVTGYIPYDKTPTSKLIKYKLTDEYLRFYFKYVEPHRQIIGENRNTRDLFTQLVKPVWSVWLGFCFENFCLKNAIYLAELMGFADKVVRWGPYFQRKDQAFQIDLIFIRNDRVITLCEIKYLNQAVPVTVIAEIERKAALLELPAGFTLEKALISRFGPDDILRETNYFHHMLQVEDFFKPR